MKHKLFFNKLWLRVGMLVAIMTTALSGSAWATDFTLSSADEVTQDGITVSFAKGSGSSAPAWYAAGLRLYASNTITISSSSTITGVTFNWEKQGSKAFASVTASTGTYSHPSNTGTGTWSGSTNSITFTLGSPGQLQLNTFSVTVSGSATPTCAAPTFSPAAGAVKSGTDVTISSSDGATIYYTTDGSTPTASSSVYTSPIEITAATTIKAFASKSGYDDSEVVTAEYTIMAPVSGYTIDFENGVDAYVDWNFENIGTSNTAITAHGGSKYGANINDAGNGVSTASIQTKEAVALPGTITCYVSKTSNNTTASTWTLSVSEDGTNWTDVDTQDAHSMDKGEWVEFTANLSGYSDVYVRLSYGSSNAIRAIDDISITMRDPNAKVTPTVTIDATGITTTDMAGNTNVAAGTLTATVASGETTISTPAVTWSSDNTSVATVDASGAVTLIGVGTATITASFAGNDDYTEASATYDLTVIDSYVKGGPNNPYTVAEAIADIEAGTGTEGICVRGVVSEIVTAYSSQYHNISYNISDDGETTSAQLEVFRGKGINGANFTSENDIQVGDVVVVYGNLTKYGTTYEFAQDNYLISLVRPEKAKHTVSFSVNGVVTSTAEVSEESEITFPEAPADINGKTFCGWVAEAISGTTDTAPTVVTSATMGTVDVTYFAVFANANTVSSEESLEITSSTEGVPGSYGTANSFDECTLGGVKFQIQQMYKTGEKLQWRAAGNKNGTGTMYNSESLGKINSVILTYESGDSNKNFTLKVGNSANPTDGTDITPTINESVYTFDCSSNECGFFVLTNGSGAGYLTKIVINYLGTSTTYSGYCTTVPVSQSVTVTPAGYATIVAKANLEIPENVEVYAVTVGESASSAQLIAVTDGVPAGNAVLVKASKGTYEFAYASTTPDAIAKNDLKASDGNITGAAGNIYALGNKTKGVGFYKVAAGVTIPAGKAYLEVTTTPSDPESGVKAFYGFEDDATGIEAIDHSPLTIEGAVYNLAGQRLQKMQKGINIVNGKKIAVK